jgi:hypothetical protein
MRRTRCVRRSSRTPRPCAPCSMRWFNSSLGAGARSRAGRRGRRLPANGRRRNLWYGVVFCEWARPDEGPWLHCEPQHRSKRCCGPRRSSGDRRGLQTTRPKAGHCAALRASLPTGLEVFCNHSSISRSSCVGAIPRSSQGDCVGNRGITACGQSRKRKLSARECKFRPDNEIGCSRHLCAAITSSLFSNARRPRGY